VTPHTVTVGLAQIGEVVWERRPSQQFQIVAGALRPKPVPSSSLGASLAYLPHSVALLEAYARRRARQPSALQFLLPLYKPMPIAAAVDHLRGADVVGFSVYVWNIRFSLAVAEAVKRARPDTLVVLGGPQVPVEAADVLRAHPFVDIVCHGEGERSFLDILERYPTTDWDGIPSISYLDRAGRFSPVPRRSRIVELDDIPSPMLDGVYDRLMQSAPEQKWLLTWETNRGCPFSCTFCDWGSATASKVSRYGMDRLFAEIDWMVDRGIQHLFVCDANFGMLPRDLEIASYIAAAYGRHRSHVAISVQSTKNRSDRSETIQRIFQQSQVVSFGASISLQSVDAGVLKAIKRDNISLDAFERLHKHYARQGLETYSDLIIGLPGETYASFASGVAKVIGNGQLNRIAFYECSVLPNAPMARPDYRKAFGVETIPVRLVHAHKPMTSGEHEVDEFIDIVVTTAAMSRDDWVRARVYAHVAELVFFDRLLHVPLTILGCAFGLDFRRMFEAFIDAAPEEFPVVAATCRAFTEHARALQCGAPQYVASTKWLSLWWPVDQHALIELAHSGQLDAFYAESQAILIRCAAAGDTPVDPVLIADAVRLNQAMFAVPFQWLDEEVETAYPIADAYQAILAGEQPDLPAVPSRCRVERTGTIWMSWESWCEDLVRRMFLRRYYLYPIHRDSGSAVERSVAGGGEVPAAHAVTRIGVVSE